MDYQAPQDLLAHKVILVTGAGDGIGRVAATTFASTAPPWCYSAKPQQNSSRSMMRLWPWVRRNPASHRWIWRLPASEDIKQLAEVLDSTYGRLDGLLHNAAMLGDRIPVEHYDINQWMTVMQVNFNAVFMLSRLMLPLLRQAPAASLLFTSSSVGAAPKAYWGPYAVSKVCDGGLGKIHSPKNWTTRRRFASILLTRAQPERACALKPIRTKIQPTQNCDQLDATLFVSHGR